MFYLWEELHTAIPYPLSLWKEVELWLRGSQSLRLWRFHYSLRYYEYYLNQEKLTLWGFFCKHFWRFRYRHCQLKYEIYIHPNQCGYGLRLCHPGYRYLHQDTQLGNNCTILPMVLIGMKGGSNRGAIIGNNVDISTGVTILSPIVIGDNVRIGAGAVVTKDVPSNSIVAGVPARVLRQYNESADNFRSSH